MPSYTLSLSLSPSLSVMHCRHQGDGHPTMATALVAFGSPDVYDLVYTMLNKTDSGCEGCHVIDDTIMPYPIYWGMSVNDWYWASGDTR